MSLTNPLQNLAFTYDLRGNRVETTQNGFDYAEYTYDAANRLTDYSLFSDDGSIVTGQWSYQYNGYGDRISQTDVLNNYTTDYLLDLTSGLTQVLGEFSPDDDTYYLMGLDVIGQQNSTNGWNYFGYDGLGSVRGMFDANAMLTQASQFDPYGNAIIDTGFNTSLGFTGEQQDDSGLTYLRARMYDPMSGVFLQKDPYAGNMTRSGSMNGYNYVEANPINHAVGEP